MKKPNINDVARLAGVSRSAVHYAFSANPNKKVSLKTRKQILEIAKEIGYTPSRLARAFSSGNNSIIGVVGHDIWTSNNQNWAYKVPHYASLAGFNAIFGTGFEISNMLEYWKSVLTWPLCGVIATGLNTEMCRIARKSFLPIVHFANIDLNDEDVLLGSSEVAAEQSIKLLEDTGCKRIAFVRNSMLTDVDARAISYCNWCLRNNFKPEIILTKKITTDSASEATIKHISENGCADAFFCQNDHAALGVHFALTSLGIKIPEEASVVGFDGIPETLQVYPQITSSAYPYDEIAQTLVDMLIYRMENPYSPYIKREVAKTLIERGSTRKINVKSDNPRVKI